MIVAWIQATTVTTIRIREADWVLAQNMVGALPCRWVSRRLARNALGGKIGLEVDVLRPWEQVSLLDMGCCGQLLLSRTIDLLGRLWALIFQT